MIDEVRTFLEGPVRVIGVNCSCRCRSVPRPLLRRGAALVRQKRKKKLRRRKGTRRTRTTVRKITAQMLLLCIHPISFPMPTSRGVVKGIGEVQVATSLMQLVN
eukprot:SAG25_NODE_4306_length_844_cov_0.828188_2_plen_103_part_01